MEKRNYWKIARVVLFFVIIATLILFLWPGCATPTTPTGSPPTSISALETRLAALEAWRPTADGAIATKALTTDLTALTTKVNALVAGTGLSAAQVDAAIDAKLAAYVAEVTALETRIATLEGGSTGGTTGSVTGTVSFVTNPAAVPQLFSNDVGSNQLFYTMRITNGSSQWQYVKPVITLNIASGYSATKVTALTISISSGAGSMAGTFAAPNNFSISPTSANVTATPNLVLIPISGGNTATGEFQIGAGQSIDVLISMQVTSSTTVLWNVSHSISSRGM